MFVYVMAAFDNGIQKCPYLVDNAKVLLTNEVAAQTTNSLLISGTSGPEKGEICRDPQVKMYG